MAVPPVTQLPELSGNGEDPVAFADMLLTASLCHGPALLYAEHFWHDPSDAAISWRIRSLDSTIVSREIEIGISPSLGSFRSVLARFGHHYMSGQLYNGYALIGLRQSDVTRRCHVYMANDQLAGFWLRIYIGGAATDL